MRFSDKKVAGAFLFVGSVQFLIVLIVEEALYSGYSVSANVISDLGVGATALIFNSSVSLLGLFIILGAYFLLLAFGSRLLPVLLVLAGVGAVGVGWFPETTGIVHDIAALVTFLFGGLSAIAAYKREKPPFSYFSVVLGLFSVGALALMVSGNYLGLGLGGMERMVAYPVLLWAVGFGAYLIGCPEEATVAA